MPDLSVGSVDVDVEIASHAGAVAPAEHLVLQNFHGH